MASTIATLFEKWHGLKTDPVVGGIVGTSWASCRPQVRPAAMLTETMVVDWAPELVISVAYLVIGNSIIDPVLFICMLQRGDATRISALLYLVHRHGDGGRLGGP